MTIDEKPLADSTVSPPGVGDRLRAEREARGLSLDDVSQTLKISRRILDQVEANAWEQLPGYTFARGIVRSYAKFVHLDAESLLRELEKAPLPKPPVLELPKSTKATIPVPGQAETRDRLAMVTGVLLVAGAALVYFLVPEEWLARKPVAVPVPPEVVTRPLVNPEPEKVAVPTSTPVSVPEVVPAKIEGVVPTVVESPVVEPIVVKKVVVASPKAGAVGSGAVFRFVEMSWIEVRDRNNVILLSENVPSGAERTVNGDAPFGITIGNSEGVRLVYRGQPVDLQPHTRQRVARLSLE